MTPESKFDVVVLGAGLAGMATACRLQAAGVSTLVLEVHDKPGGCAGYYEREGFSFDIGATTLVDFEANGVGGEFLNQIGLTNLECEHLPGYQAWLPDRTLILHRDQEMWERERAMQLGDSEKHRRLWRLLDQLADVFWPAAVDGIRLPIQNFSDIRRAVSCLGWGGLPYSRHLFSSLGRMLKRYDLDQVKPLVGLLSMLCEDTLHARGVSDAPVINAALGTSIRARIARPVGGMRGFWTRMIKHYGQLGGELRLKTKVVRVDGRQGAFLVKTKRGDFKAGLVVNTIPLPSFEPMAPDEVRGPMRRYLRRDKDDYGAGVVLCIGVPEEEVACQEHRHHQLLQSYEAPLGDGNNMFISVSKQGDKASAPDGYRSVMISTHTNIERWRGLSPGEYKRAKAYIGKRLLSYARRVYPALGSRAQVFETGTPRAYVRFARRPEGAVGGVRMNMRNANQWAMPCDLGKCGIYFSGDYTWPGLGSVACVLCSRIVAEKITARA